RRGTRCQATHCRWPWCLRPSGTRDPKSGTPPRLIAAARPHGALRTVGAAGARRRVPNIRKYSEIDRVDWRSVAEARSKLLKGQRPLLDRLNAAPERGEPGRVSTR